jgi:outer membrane protein OmpA-like peptidoglycan-associated protein
MKLLWSGLLVSLLVAGAQAQGYGGYPYTPRVVVRSYSNVVAASQPITYLIAFQDGAIRLADAYWVRDRTFHYVTVDHRERTAPLASVDRRLSEQLNSDRNVVFYLPAVPDRTTLRHLLTQKLDLVLETRDTSQGVVVRISDTYFQFNDYHLTPQARVKLARIAGILLAYGGLSPRLQGYTDNVGTADYNLQLSYKRAESVREFLISQGVPAASLTAKGSGSANPVASNTTDEGRRQNRRVEMWISEDAIATASLPVD